MAFARRRQHLEDRRWTSNWRTDVHPRGAPSPGLLGKDRAPPYPRKQSPPRQPDDGLSSTSVRW
jgi:hypothetical protein